jgi:hypothetical protein
MATVEEIEKAVAQLSKEDFDRLFEWLVEFEHERWDRQIEEDSAAGRLDRFAEEALREYQDGLTKEL